MLSQCRPGMSHASNADRIHPNMSSTETFSPGNVVVVRDEDWLITSVDESSDGPVLNTQGLSELVRGQDANFYPSIVRGIRLYDPRDTTVRADDSPRHRRSRLCMESTPLTTAVPLSDDCMTVLPRMLARRLSYQHKTVANALDPPTLRPRILLADSIGLGKTLCIGMILPELIRTILGHCNSAEVVGEVGADWAERLELDNPAAKLRTCTRQRHRAKCWQEAAVQPRRACPSAQTLLKETCR